MSSTTVEKTIIKALELKVAGHYLEALMLLESALQTYPHDEQLQVLARRIHLLAKIRV